MWRTDWLRAIGMLTHAQGVAHRTQGPRRRDHNQMLKVFIVRLTVEGFRDIRREADK